MEKPLLRLSRWHESFCIVRLPAESRLPGWANGEFISVTRTADELSIVAAEESVPDEVEAERGWTLLAVEGPIELSAIGVLASLADPLAEAGVSIFVISTHDTDYLLVRESDLKRALAALRSAGHLTTERPAGAP